MSPRPYQLGKRQGQIEQSRQRVIDGARSLLGEAAGYTAFTVDAVARRADVARATIYYQFESKTGLLEALCDHLAEAGRISELAAAFAEPDPDAALAAFIGCFGRFWAVDRLVMRRLRALAALDPEVGAVIASRDERRRAGLAAVVSRPGGRPGGDGAGPDGVLPLLYAITSFETFDAAAGPEQDLTELVPGIVQLALAALRTAGTARGCQP
ncbi:MAG TPA: helix-turn-helix domain-containing protein [Streptosporangiaceae bacterium]|jgi:AcrR family transcriptional regulator